MEALRELALFAGAGGGILGGALLGWRTVCAVEINAYCRNVLLARQRDGHLPQFPVWDDVRTFDGKPWCGHVDVISGGFPCQDISCAGKGAGIEGERSGLWSEFARIIREVGPQFVFVENSPMLTSRGLGRVLGDLAEMGFDARWGVLGAEHVGACHRRHRIFIFACSSSNSNQDYDFRKGITAINRQHKRKRLWLHPKNVQKRESWLSELASMGFTERVYSYTDARRGFYGVASGVDRRCAIGNGQVPAVVRLAVNVLGGSR